MNKHFLAVFDGVPQAEVNRSVLTEGLGIIDALASEETAFLKSKGEARRDLKANAISVNKDKVNEEFLITEDILLNEKYVLLQKGKKNYFLLKVN